MSTNVPGQHPNDDAVHVRQERDSCMRQTVDLARRLETAAKRAEAAEQQLKELAQRHADASWYNESAALQQSKDKLAALARAEAAEKRCAELEELRRQDEAHGHWCVATARERDDALKRCAELEARVTYWQEAEAALLREYGEMADRLLCDKHDAEKRYRMERHDHLEASESYVKAANERAWWEGRAVEAEKTLDEFARTYADAVSRYEAAEKRCAELEAMYECVYCEHTARGETERDEALKRCEELEAERDQWMRRFSRSAAEGIRALEERDEAQRVARVLAEFASTHTHGAGSERDLAIRAALAYLEQKPESREPSDDTASQRILAAIHDHVVHLFVSGLGPDAQCWSACTRLPRAASLKHEDDE